MDLAIGHFDLRNGSFTFAERKIGTQRQRRQSARAVRLQRRHHDVHRRNRYQPAARAVEALNAPVDIDVKLPVTMEKDKITLTAAADRHAAIEDRTVRARWIIWSRRILPVICNAQIALDEVRRVAGLEIPLDTAHGPRVLNADVTASMDESRIQVQSARVTLGQSNLEASRHAAGCEPSRRRAVPIDPGGGRIGPLAAGGGASGGHGDARRQCHAGGKPCVPRYRQRGGSRPGIPAGRHAAGGDQPCDRTSRPTRIASTLDNLRVAGLGGNFAGKAAHTKSGGVPT